MPAFDSRLRAALAERRSQGLLRQTCTLHGGNQVEIADNERRYLNFSSNDYLGLATNATIGQAWQQGITVYGNGSGASPLVTGHGGAHQALQERLCEWLGYERAVLFSSGFAANQALLLSLLQQGDVLIQDKLNHASLMEAGVLCPATMKRFKHNDMAHLRQVLNTIAPEAATLVVTEGVFSMDGDLAPLQGICELTEQQAWLAVDDAHGIGVLGEGGRGSCQHAGIKPQVLIVTFGKAFGLSGAAILCHDELADYLTQFARHYVYSTAMPGAQAVALHKASEIIEQQQWRRDKLAELTALYDQLLSDEPGYVATPTPIKPWLIGESDDAVATASQLKQQGIWLTAIRPPTVPKGSARLRITLTANHTKTHIHQLAQAIKGARKPTGRGHSCTR